MTHSKVDLIIKGAIAALLVALGFVIVWSMQEHIVGVGDTAPNFTITTTAGDQVTPRNFGGKVLVLNFWASWCAPCVQEAPSLNEFAKTFKDSGVVVLGVSVDRNEQLYQNFVKRFGVSYPTGARSGRESELPLRHLQDSRELHYRSQRQSGAEVRRACRSATARRSRGWIRSWWAS